MGAAQELTTDMSNALITTKNWMPSGPMVIGPIMGVFAYGRVSTAADARPRGGVLRFVPLD